MKPRAAAWVAQTGVDLFPAAPVKITAAMEFGDVAATRLHMSFGSRGGEYVDAALELHSFPHELGAAAAMDVDALRLHIESRLHADLGFSFDARLELAL